MNTPLIETEFWTRILFSVLCGFIIGAERQLRGKPVGIRTSILICMGTMLFIYMGQQVPGDSDSTRVLGQIVTGIGFLGAGVIMNKEGLVSGVTSASIVWLLAGIGAAIGFEYYMTALQVSLVALGVLVGVEYFEEVFKSILQRGVHRRED